ADADGDGIADSFLSRLPIGTINGITYYYAVRIIDNAAAVNLNTAWGDQITMATGTASGDRLFPTSINLNYMFSNQEVNSLYAYRRNTNTGAAPPPFSQWDKPWDDNAKGRND